MSTAMDLHPGRVSHVELINKIVIMLQPAAIYQHEGLWVIALPNNCSVSPANALKILSVLPHSVCLRIHTIGDLLTEINTGSILLNHLCKRRNLIYNSNILPLPIPFRERLANASTHARIVFNFGKLRSDAFLNGALFYLGQNEINLCSFMLHQSVEMILRSALHALTGQEVKTHLITELNQKMKTWLPSLLYLPDNPELLQRLDASYTGVRYNPLYEISFTDVALIAREVPKLLQTAERTVQSIVPDGN